VGPGVACKGPQKSVAKPTLCDPAKRSVNTGAKCGAADDWHKPPDGGFGGIYVNTTHAKLGDSGSKVLPKTASGATWKAGLAYEVTWTIEANHGGGCAP
jgi:hypothetical protein